MQNKFAFFANFAETIRETIPPEKQAAAYQAICEYGIYGTLPDDPVLKVMCLMAKASIYNKGGAPEGNKNAQKQKDNKEEKQPKTTQNNLKQPKITETIKNNQNNSFLETETETRNKKLKQETETEKGCSGEPPNKQYAFEGKIIKLKQKDFDAWKLAYPDLNLRAELLQRDIWLQAQPPEEQKKWFLSTSQFFIKQNERRKAQNADIAEQYGTANKPENDNVCWF